MLPRGWGVVIFIFLFGRIFADDTYLSPVIASGQTQVTASNPYVLTLAYPVQQTAFPQSQVVTIASITTTSKKSGNNFFSQISGTTGQDSTTSQQSTTSQSSESSTTGTTSIITTGNIPTTASPATTATTSQIGTTATPATTSFITTSQTTSKTSTTDSNSSGTTSHVQTTGTTGNPPTTGTTGTTATTGILPTTGTTGTTGIPYVRQLNFNLLAKNSFRLDSPQSIKNVTETLGTTYWNVDPITATPKIKGNIYSYLLNISTNDPDTFTVNTELIALPVEIPVANNIIDQTQVCVGMRYYSFEIPADGFGHNVSFALGLSVPNYYSTLYLRAEYPPDLSLPNGGGWSVSAAASLFSQNYNFKNLLAPGKYYAALQCTNPGAAIGQITYTVTLAQTCPLGCFTNGQCLTDDFFVPFCVCDLWHTGADCASIFSGTYVLGVVLGILLVVILGCVIAKIRYCLKPVRNHEDEDVDQVEKISLLGSTNAE